jgi:hypothetical protein
MRDFGSGSQTAVFCNRALTREFQKHANAVPAEKPEEKPFAAMMSVLPVAKAQMK